MPQYTKSGAKPLPDGTTTPGQSWPYLYSFSGADADTFVWFDRGPELIDMLESVHTISVSVHEAKGQARALGYRGIKGLARGVRTIAGSMILTVVNDHPLRTLMMQRDAIWGANDPLGWSLDRDRVGTGTLFNNYDYVNRMAVLLPPFNLAVQYVSEAGPQFRAELAERPEGAGWMLKGVEFIDEGQVTSVNDIVTEMTFSFIACDFKPLAYYSDRTELSALYSDYLDAEREYALYKALMGGDPYGRGETYVRGANEFDPLRLQ
jgi:hypothetical protein